MADALNTYKSTLTPQEVDEAFRNIGKVQANIEKAAGYAQTAEQYGTIVQQNQAAIQAIEDNLPAVQGAAANAQNAAANAQAAAASAAAAQQAAQEALGFRTFFSAVTPDANGDLDPSRPMTTPTAASVMVKSKGDRIQSVQVNGFTQQAGAGDPSPVNVREISTAGMKLVKFTANGTSENGYTYINKSSSGNNYRIGIKNSSINAYTNKPYSYSTVLPYNASYYLDEPHFYNATGELVVILPATSYSNALSYLAENPITFWYPPANESQATGLYIPKIAQGHEYRCEMMKLTALLCAGDKVESCVPSGCDKTLTIDGSTVTVTASGSNYVVTAADAAASGNVYAEGLAYLSLTAGQVVIPASSFPASVTSAQTANAWLRSNPQKVWYQSTAYTDANDIPVQLETHARQSIALTGEESNTNFLDVYNIPLLFKGKGGTYPICSHAPSTSPYGSAASGIYVSSGGTQLALKLLGIAGNKTAYQEYLAAQYAAGTPVTVVYELATNAVYAHDPVTLMAVPYTQADVDAANRLASRPSTLPSIDSPDVPMLLNDAGNSDSAAQVMALAANAVPVVGTYVVSSQDGTTLAVSIKAMQDGGDASTLGGKTAEELVALQSPKLNNVLTKNAAIASDTYSFSSSISKGSVVSVNLQRESKGITSNTFLYTGPGQKVVVRCAPNDNTGVEMYSEITVNDSEIIFGNWYCGYEYQGALNQDLCTSLYVYSLSF